MILIITQALDPHADSVIQHLEARNVDFFRFHPADFPSQSSLSFWLSKNGQPHYCLQTPERTVELEHIQSIWYRRPLLPQPHPQITQPLTHAAVIEECEPFLQDVWNSLCCFWLPAPVAVFRRVQWKASQLKIAGELGFELPPTLITNSPEDFLQFYRQYNGHIINKRIGFAFFSTSGTPFVRYTEVVSKRDVGYAHSIRYCPLIFQAYIPKSIELRITVVGQSIFAAEIHSQASNHAQHDWRRYDSNEVRYYPHELPVAIQHLCLQLVQKLGLFYGAIDMILTPDGRYVFIEINPNGQYLWVELETGLPISEAICDLLISPPQLDPEEIPLDECISSKGLIR